MTTRKLVGWTAIVAPLLHTATGVLEWTQGGFSRAQLWLSYAAFLPVPALMRGLYAMQRPGSAGRGDDVAGSSARATEQASPIPMHVSVMPTTGQTALQRVACHHLARV